MSQPPLVLHELLVDMLLLPEDVEKDEKSLVVSFEPHFTHSTGSFILLKLMSVSNFSPHFSHLYSYKGIDSHLQEPNIE